MIYDYGIVYKKCRPRKDGFFIETSILYRICSARSPSQLPIMKQNSLQILKRNFFMISYPQFLCGGFLIGQIQRKGQMTNKQKELIARNIMLVLLLMLVAMTISTFVWGYWL